MSYYFPKTKISALGQFLSFNKPAEHKPEFPPSSWDLDKSRNDGTGATDWDPDAWTQEIERMNKLSVSDEKPPSDAPEPVSLANRIKMYLTGGLADDNPHVDSKLVNLLSSESVMNGENSANKESVWQILQRLGRKRDTGEAIMVYAPLKPDSDSEVEIAETEDRLEYLDEPSEDGDAAKPPQPRRREWVPSPSKVSIETCWWGFRLYLPPPVLDVLSDAHLAAAARGAMITATIKWILDKIPTTLVPPTLRPAMMTLKRLTPYLGYIGAFVAWSWERIKKRDKGHGVVLTATWLLPIALIPASWDLEVHGAPKAEESRPA